MDFLFTEEQERFRQEVCSFLATELPLDWVDYIGTAIDDTVVHREDGWQVFKDMAHKLGEKGWLSLFWPKEYGGQSCSYVDYLIFLEVTCSPKTVPPKVRLLWDNHILRGGLFHEEFEAHAGAGSLRHTAG